jgi:hypothetical protein
MPERLASCPFAPEVWFEVFGSDEFRHCRVRLPIAADATPPVVNFTFSKISLWVLYVVFE